MQKMRDNCIHPWPAQINGLDSISLRAMTPEHHHLLSADEVFKSHVQSSALYRVAQSHPLSWSSETVSFGQRERKLPSPLQGKSTFLSSCPSFFDLSAPFQGPTIPHYH